MAQVAVAKRDLKELADRIRAAWRDRAWTPARTWTLWHGDRVLPLVAAALLAVTIFMPFWSLKLHAPQYIGGLEATIWLDHASGDVQEIDGLNHYIGMRPLDEAAQTERSLSMVAVPAMAAVAALAAVRRRWTWIFAIPAILFPAIFMVDLYYWLYTFGNNLDPTAALSNSIKEFTPTMIGTGKVGQFRTTAMFDIGFWVALLASILLVLALVSRRWKARHAP